MTKDEQLAALARLIASSPHNLVSSGDRALLATTHVPESVALAQPLGAAHGSSWLDLGTGGGLPGLALAIDRPDVRWTLLDATAKKVRAVASFAAELGLDNVETVCARAEDAAWDPAYRGSFDGVVARAVAPLAVLAELARGFVRPGGMLGAVKGPTWEDEARQATTALARLRWELLGGVGVTSAVRPTWLVRMRAVGEPPKAFPRKVGVPRSAPLGSP